MSNSRKSVFRLACALISIIIVSAVTGFSSAFLSVNIVGIPGGVTQSLPISYVQSFQRWIVDDGKVLSRVCNSKISQIEWNDGTKIRPTLDILIKSGAPAYAMAGLQVKGNNEEYCPLARQWTTFSFAVEPTFRVEAFTSTDSDLHKPIFARDCNPVDQMKTAMELFGVVLSQSGEGSPLSDGFHILSIPLDGWTPLPSMEDSAAYTLTCLATAEPEAEELLTMDPGLVEMTASSVLELRVVPTGVEAASDADGNSCSENDQ
jgi:hypothetical protein